VISGDFGAQHHNWGYVSQADSGSGAGMGAHDLYSSVGGVLGAR